MGFFGLGSFGPSHVVGLLRTRVPGSEGAGHAVWVVVRVFRGDSRGVLGAFFGDGFCRLFGCDVIFCVIFHVVMLER